MNFTQANIVNTSEEKTIITYFVDITDKTKKESLLSSIKKIMETKGYKKKQITEMLNWGNFRIDISGTVIPDLYYVSEDGVKIMTGYKFSKEEQKKIRKLCSERTAV